MSSHAHDDTGQHDGGGNGHLHAHAHAQSFPDANAQYFDAHAHEMDERPAHQELAQRVSAALLDAYQFKEEETVVMDFACGTGLVSRALAPHAKTIIGVDISQGSVDEFNRRVENQGILPEEMRAVRAELKGEDSELDGLRFDLIVCSMAYHHFASYVDMTRILAFFLKAGGHLFVVDIMKNEDGMAVIPQKFGHIVPHLHGLSESDMRGAFEGAGLQDFSYGLLTKMKRNGKDESLFLTKGVKAL
ncbi:S-adenosyl-L-methionine-dependent methyltransferase [Auriscalpium vulgare]|uniref:S-adenosyl-L-methionine-dependent methyltransferase n=1 Tax=Auriscalpium vulgare TaxID=40419 RepID=A0ACB8RS54_9AGAM|nr:S-adenosyl-L-methionine-dependent methyltransferase [Auriscalpium vulgare]